ncbi:MAG TPA: TlpA family protein disulfide reductase [Deltaproteobacteria bacterium]|nr:TlpA family protein disulfide reductase [Deltaproteobacteria bacterium]
MNRSILAICASSLLLVGCNDPEMDKRIADLEGRVEALEARPASPGGAKAASPEQEQEAANLLKAATEAAEAMDIETAKAKLEELKSKHGATRAARAAQRLESELAVIGKPEAELDVEKWFQGSAADVEGGKATLYVFWEVWCPHCKREVPKLSETYNKFKPQGLSMVGLTKQTRDVTDDQVTAFVSEQHVSYPIAKENGDSLSQHYGVRGIPAAAMVKDGKVVWRGHPARLTDEMISKWLGS